MGAAAGMLLAVPVVVTNDALLPRAPDKKRRMKMYGHNVKRHTLGTRMTGFLLLLLFVSAASSSQTGCSEEETETTETATLGYNSETHTIEVVIEPGDPIYVVSCTDIYKVYRVENGSRGDLVGSGFDPLDVWKGYFRDDVFVFPDFTEGCDVLSCMPIEDAGTSLALVEYSLKGTRVLTAEEKAAAEARFPSGYPGSVPDQVNEYTTAFYTGEVEVELSYYGTDTCDSNEVAPKTEVHRISVQ